MKKEDREDIKEIVEQAFDEEAGTIEMNGEFSGEILEETAKCVAEIKANV